MSKSTIHISAIILSFNSERFISRCLDSLLKSFSEMESHNEIIIIENGSSDRSPELIKNYQIKNQETIKVIEFENNTGTTYSRNAGIKIAGGDFILILDSDAYVSKPALEILTEHLVNEAKTGLAVPRLSYASGNFQLSCDVFPTLPNKLKRFFFLKEIESNDQNLSKATMPTEVDYAISACWMLKKESVKKAGLLDENIFYSPEDVDYCIRIWKSGYKIMYLPGAQVVHDAQELSRGFKLTKFHFHHLFGLIYIMWKHKYWYSATQLRKKINL